MKQEPSDREPRACMAYYAWILALSCGLATGIGIGAGVGIGVGAGVAVGLVLYRWSKSDSGDGWYRAMGEPLRLWAE
jgi:hypothetical protein